MSTASVRRAESVAPRGIVAPKPEILMDVKAHQRVEVRPGEPVHLFLASSVGAGRSIAGLNKRTPFTVTLMEKAPVGAAATTRGAWFKIEARPTAKVGTTDRVSVQLTPVVLNPVPVNELFFTLVVGAQRQY